ncbi:ERF family protein [Sphingobacterium sp. 1.A.4]|uniref:ERF family protein n=1 Tax=Sphingobacterium sp. 1.A.4 TaxID=2044603 RepID=UPI000C0BBDDB|nr:ERF family protein [Sphingobacterium sp. 1.A.4]
METQIKGIYPKLHKIQKKINGLGKDKQAFGYKYVTGDKVLEHVKPMMNELGLLLKQEVLSIDNSRQDYNTKNGAKSEILSKVDMRFTWIDIETGEKDENLFGANGQNDWDKGVGSALTYAERYFLLKFFHIATDEDDIDNPERKPQEQPQAEQKSPVPTIPLMPSNEVLWNKVKVWALEKGTKQRIEKIKESYIISEADFEKIKSEIEKSSKKSA